MPRAHVPLHQPNRHQLRHGHVLPHAQERPRKTRRPPKVRQLHRRGLLHRPGLPRQQVDHTALAPARHAELGELLSAVVAEAHDPLVQASTQAQHHVLAGAHTGVLHARIVHIVDG